MGVAIPIALTEQLGWEGIPVWTKQNLLEELSIIGLRTQTPYMLQIYNANSKHMKASTCLKHYT